MAIWPSLTTLVLLIPLVIGEGEIDISTSFTYNDQKQNCTKNVTGSFCYNGPRFDALGQYKSCVIPGTVALTFDDNPSPATPYILDVLKEYGMKATFFMIGQNVYANPDIVQRVISEGHQIASHTYTHPWVTNITDDQFRRELELFENAIMQRNFDGLSGFMIPSYFRSPHGNIDTAKMNILRDYGYIPIHWSFLNGDSYINDSSRILPVWKLHFGDTTNYPKLNLIVQQHDAEPATNGSFAAVAEWLNATFVSQGVKFVTIADCLNNGVPAYRPSPRRYEDPTCENGVKFSSPTVGQVCCAASCKTCGGSGCSQRPGGVNACCVNQILTNNLSCKYSSPGCVM
jgi:peptidoglycan/xylan/chitin deacetylase (PgdA/CDA1 family)